jgi:ribonuclease-3
LALLGDSVLGLAITTHLFPLLDAETYGAGRLTKIRAQAVSGRSCRAVADRLGLPGRLRAAAPVDVAQPALDALVSTERVLASVIEAVIGACYLAYGFETTARAVREAFAPEIELALERPADFKSTLQERLARRGAVVMYEVTLETGPPHERIFEVAAIVGGHTVARGTGRSKKEAEQAAAAAALEAEVEA